jgi:hypothetical protein
MKKFLYTVLFTFTVFPAFAQSWETVKNSREYLCGEGWGTTVAEADKQALNDLISKVSLQVSGKISHSETETATNSGVEASSNFSSVVSTYSSATLTNTEKVIITNEPDAHVGRWIRRTELNKIFEGRKNKIADYISSALKAESQGKIDIALKDLYWALALTKTLQDPNSFNYTTEEGETVVVLSWIPRTMNEIFGNLNATVQSRDGSDVELKITYKGKPVNSVDYSFFDGRDWSNIYSAQDGVGILELAPGNESENIQLRYEYEYRGEAQIDREIETVLNAIGGIPMRNAYKNVSSKNTAKKQKKVEEPATSSFASISADIYKMPTEVTDNSKYQSVISRLSTAIVSKKYDSIDDLFTDDAKDIYQRLIKYGNAKIVGTPQYKFYQYGDCVIARGLQMSFSFKSGLRKSFVEEVVFSFDMDGKINNISFGLGKTAEADILGKGVWSQEARFAIMSFLENYQTAYALKRLDYIESIFDDDAVIITATVTHVPSKISGGDFGKMTFAHDIIKYNRQTKDTYLKNLKNSFSSKEYINIRFANNDVRKLGKGGELYAVQLSQEYYSSNYGDKGYLFLMIDINNPKQPIIKVRTWQPERDPEFGLYGPEHFK